MLSENIKLDKDKGQAIVFINPNIYSLEVVYSAAYVFLDKAYFILDGDPKEKIQVIIKPKNKDIDLEKLVLDFNNELINYSVYVIQAARKQPIREAIIKRALATNIGSELSFIEEIEEEPASEEDWIDDPEGIAKPWTPEKAKGLKPPEEICEEEKQ